MGKKKCPSCNSCLDVLWIMPRRFYHCFLEDIYFDIKDDKLVVVNVEEEMNIHKNLLDKVMETNGNFPNKIQRG